MPDLFEPSEETDGRLLERYVEHRCETAFAELVRRHVALVYSAGLRQLEGDTHRAEDVCQAVFVEVARQANQLRHHPVLTGWLHVTTHHLVQRLRRGERRRLNREHEAQLMQELNATPTADEPGSEIRELRRVMDGALQELREADRLAILMRYFEGASLRTVATALGVGDDAARMRLERALERLRELLVRRGLDLTKATLLAGLGTMIVPVPATLAGHITASVCAGTLVSVAAGASGGAAATAIWTPIAMMKTPLLTAAMAAAMIAVPLVLQQQDVAAARKELAALQRSAEQLPSLRAEEEERRRRAETRAVERWAVEAEELRQLREESARLRAALTHPLQTELIQAEAARFAAQAAWREVAAREAFQQTRKKTVQDLKQIVLAARIAVHDRESKHLPQSFEEYIEVLKEQFPELTADDLARYEFYPQPRLIPAEQADAFFLREKQPRPKPEGGWERVYGMVDGSVQTFGSDTPDFNEVERRANGILSP